MYFCFVILVLFIRGICSCLVRKNVLSLEQTPQSASAYSVGDDYYDDARVVWFDETKSGFSHYRFLLFFLSIIPSFCFCSFSLSSSSCFTND